MKLKRKQNIQDMSRGDGSVAAKAAIAAPLFFTWMPEKLAIYTPILDL